MTCVVLHREREEPDPQNGCALIDTDRIILHEISGRRMRAMAGEAA